MSPISNQYDVFDQRAALSRDPALQLLIIIPRGYFSNLLIPQVLRYVTVMCRTF